jgi:hypothetical protein
MFGYGYTLYRGDKGRMTGWFREMDRKLRLHVFGLSPPPRCKCNRNRSPIICVSEQFLRRTMVTLLVTVTHATDSRVREQQWT